MPLKLCKLCSYWGLTFRDWTESAKMFGLGSYHFTYAQDRVKFCAEKSIPPCKTLTQSVQNVNPVGRKTLNHPRGTTTGSCALHTFVVGNDASAERVMYQLTRVRIFSKFHLSIYLNVSGKGRKPLICR